MHIHSIYGVKKFHFLRSELLNNSLHLRSEEISLVEEWIALDSNSSRVKINFSTSGISSGSLDTHSKRSDHWGHFPGSDLSDKQSENSLHFLESTWLIITGRLYVQVWLWHVYHRPSNSTPFTAFSPSAINYLALKSLIAWHCTVVLRWKLVLFHKAKKIIYHYNSIHLKCRRVLNEIGAEVRKKMQIVAKLSRKHENGLIQLKTAISMHNYTCWKSIDWILEVWVIEI